MTDKVFRTHDGWRGNRLAVTVRVDEDNVAWIGAVSGRYSPDGFGVLSVGNMMRTLDRRIARWVAVHGFEAGDDGGPRLSEGDWS